MKKFKEKVVGFLKSVFGYGIMLCLFGGGLTFLGYIAAFVIGGDTATKICVLIYKTIIPILIKTSSIMVLLGLITMYICGESALTSGKSKRGKQKNS